MKMQGKESSAWVFPAPFSGWSGRTLKSTHAQNIGNNLLEMHGIGSVIQALNSAMKSELGNSISMDFLSSPSVCSYPKPSSPCRVICRAYSGLTLPIPKQEIQAPSQEAAALIF